MTLRDTGFVGVMKHAISMMCLYTDCKVLDAGRSRYVCSHSLTTSDDIRSRTSRDHCRTPEYHHHHHHHHHHQHHHRRHRSRVYLRLTGKESLLLNWIATKT